MEVLISLVFCMNMKGTDIVSSDCADRIRPERAYFGVLHSPPLINKILKNPIFFLIKENSYKFIGKHLNPIKLNIHLSFIQFT